MCRGSLRLPNCAKDFPSNQVRHTRDSKSWCRGKVGVEHKPEWVPAFGRHSESGLVWAEDQICRSCKKKLGFRHPSYSFGTLVRAARQQREMTQRQLADLLKITEERVCQVEADSAANPTLKTIAKFGHALKTEFRLSFLGRPIMVDGYAEAPGYPEDEDWLRF